MGQFDAAAAAYLRGLAILGDRPVAQRAALMGALGALSGLAGFLEVSEDHFAEAIEIATALVDTNELGRLHWGRSVAYFSNQRWPQALDDGRRSTELLREVGDLWTLVDALGWQSLPLIGTGHPDEARTVAAEAVELGVKLGHRTGATLARRIVVLSDAWNGQITLPEVISAARDDLLAMEAMELPWVSQSHAWLSGLLTQQGDLDDGLAQADLAIASEPLSGFSGIGVAFRFLNRAYAGDTAACRTMVEDQLPALPLRVTELRVGTAVLLNALSEGCALLGWADAVEPLYPAVSEAADLGISRVFDMAMGHRVAGMAAMTLQRWDEARRHLQLAIAPDRGMAPNVFDRPHILHRSAELALRMPGGGDDLDARTLLTQAIQGYRASGRPVLLASAVELGQTLA
jgi:tetratricopeptide (TPR) repeat protein